MSFFFKNESTTINSYGGFYLDKYIILFDIFKIIMLICYFYIWYIYYRVTTYKPVSANQHLLQDIITLEHTPYCYLELSPCSKKINSFINKWFYISNDDYIITCNIIFSVILYLSLSFITFIFLEILYIWVA